MARPSVAGTRTRSGSEFPIFEWDIVDSEIAAITASSAGDVLPSPILAGDVIRVATTTDVFFRMGAGAQTAVTTDPILTVGVHYLRVPVDATNFAAIRVSADGTLTVTALNP